MKKLVLCPSCKTVVPREEGLRPGSFPFCSDRCRMTDLGRWFAGDYKVPQPIGPEDNEAIEEVLRAREPDA